MDISSAKNIVSKKTNLIPKKTKAYKDGYLISVQDKNYDKNNPSTWLTDNLYFVNDKKCININPFDLEEGVLNEK